jgi:spermidine synthase
MRALPYLVFFASGFAALVYQIVWQRLLVIFSGSDIHSATVIVAAFMAGLGCGNLAGGHIADRLPRANALAAFVAAELAIAVFGIFSAQLYYDVLYRRLGHMALGIEGRGAVLFVSLLWPTFFMGVSLPLLARALTVTVGQAAGVTGALYACNTAGAAIGAFAATWILLPAFGLETTLRISAVINLCAGAGALPLALAAPRPIQNGGEPTLLSRMPAASGGDPAAPLAFGTWGVMYALSGFLALSLEIVWFRLLGVMLKSTAFTFGTLLGIYLAGIGLGAAAGALLIRRVRRPAHLFVTLQAAVALYAGASVSVLFALVNNGAVPMLAEYFARYEALDVGAALAALRGASQGSGDPPGRFLLLYVVLPSLMIGPPTLMMGASFPLLQKAVQTDLSRVGARVGTLLTANIAGSTLGSIVTGWGLLGWLGTSGTLRLLVAVAAAYPICALVLWSRSAVSRRRRAAYAGTIAALALVVAVMPDSRTLWARVHGGTRPFVVVGEDGSGASVLRIAPSQQQRVVVFVNGIGQSWLPYGGIHTALGALPAFLHPDPRHAAVIGLGSGDTLFAIAGRQELERITCIEIVKPQLDTLRRLHETWPYAGLRTILSDPRIAHVYGDGRLHVANATEKYDLIEADALRPTSAYSGNLYSDTYFALLRDRLKPGGLAVSWSPTMRVHNTFVKMFPHVLSYGDIVVGSNQAIAFDAGTLRTRLAHPNVQAHYRESGIDIQAVLAPYLERAPRVFAPGDDRSSIVDVNTDLYPKDEFSVPAASAPPR